MKIYRPTTLAFIHQTPGLNTRSSATAVAIIHISGCDSLPPQSSSHLVIVNLPIWLSIPVRMLVFRVLSFDYPERQLRLFTSRDVTVYTFSPKWEQSFDYQFGIPFEKITFTLLTHIHQMSSGSWFPGSCHSILRSDGYDYSHFGMWQYSTSYKLRVIWWLLICLFNYWFCRYVGLQGLIIRLSGATVTIIHISGCDSLLFSKVATIYHSIISLGLPLIWED
jgi:hypothetical protein